jgi:radical SAM superfamily enzyme YgiQ (UPF0313 family)
MAKRRGEFPLMTGGKRTVILFRPLASDTYRQGEMPLQLLAIARMLLGRYRVRLVAAELGLRRKSDADLKAEIEEDIDDCLFFGVTAMTGWGLRQALDLSRFVRERAPDTKVVWGGWHASLTPRQTLAEPEIDCVVIGQGEHTVVELAAAIEAGEEDLSGIRGLGWKRNGETVLNAPRPVADINAFPPLPYHLLDDEAFRQPSHERTAAFYTSVACPHNCGFCADRAVYGGHWQGLTPERALAEIRDLRERYGVTSLRILDSNFFPDWRRGCAILKGIHDLGMRALWVNARIPRLLAADDEDLELFRKTVGVFLVGAESGSEAALELISKHQSVESIREVARRYAAHDVAINFSTIIGIPFDDPEMWKEEFAATVALLDELLKASNYLHKAQVHVYTPYPGTPLFDKAVELGFKPPERLTDWADVELFTSNLPYLPPGLDEQVEFLTTHILQLLWPEYRFYQGKNPVARGAYGVAQALLTALARLRWRTKYFRHPIEFRLVRRLLAGPREGAPLPDGEQSR